MSVFSVGQQENLIAQSIAQANNNVAITEFVEQHQDEYGAEDAQLIMQEPGDENE